VGAGGGVFEEVVSLALFEGRRDGTIEVKILWCSYFGNPALESWANKWGTSRLSPDSPLVQSGRSWLGVGQESGFLLFNGARGPRNEEDSRTEACNQ
jgi:hypothetical protein